MKGAANWKARACRRRTHQAAYRDALPVRAILLAGKRRNDDDPEPESTVVEARVLDTTQWAVTTYNFQTGEFVLTRGVDPITGSEQDDPEYTAFEGEERRLYVLHRRRESALRKKASGGNYREWRSDQVRGSGLWFRFQSSIRQAWRGIRARSPQSAIGRSAECRH
jgi:hypothetical protein